MSNYIKKYDLGEMYLDLPYANCIYELPLLSFGDLKGSVKLSLVFNQALGGGNLYHIANGYKLNLEKRLLVGDTTYYIEANGKRTQLTVNGSGDSIRYTFPDDSGRIIRKTFNKQNQFTGYQLEYADFSYELYDANGKITAAYDKYGDKVLKFTYNDLGAVLSIGFRIADDDSAAKTISFAYTNDQLTSISFNGDSSATTMIAYASPYVIVQHYSAVVYKLKSETSKFTAEVFESETAAVATYSKICEKNESLVTLSDKENDVQIQQTQYFFGDANYVEITDNQGVRTRVQFDGDKAMCSYEIGETDVAFMHVGNGEKCTSNVQMSYIKERERLVPVGTVQSFYDGYAMTQDEDIPRSWYLREFPNIHKEDEEGIYVVSGWIKTDKEADIWIGVVGDADESGPVHPECFQGDKWMFFSYKVAVQTQGYDEMQFYIEFHPNATKKEVKDVRVTFFKTHEKTENDKLIPLSEDLLVRKSDNMALLLRDAAFSIDGLNSENDAVTFEDLLRYWLRPQANEFYYNRLKSVKTINAPVKFTYNEEEHTLSDFKLCKCTYTAEQGYHWTYYNEATDSAFWEVYTVDQNGSLIKKYRYNEYMDVIDTTESNVNITYTRNKGLITQATQWCKSSDTNAYERVASISISYEETDEGFCIKQKDLAKSTNPETTYYYDSVWGFLKKIVYPNGSTVEGFYDSDGGVLTGKVFRRDASYLVHNFGHANGKLSSISRQGGGLHYAFGYDNKGELASVAKNGSMVEQYSRAFDSTNKQTTVTGACPNSTSPLYSIARTFDKYGRLVSVGNDLNFAYDIAPAFEEDGSLIEKADNGSARLAMTVDSVANEETRYIYNQYGILSGILITGENEFSYKKVREDFSYDRKNRLAQRTYYSYTMGLENKVEESFTYRESYTSPNSLSSYQVNIGDVPKLTVDYTYDVLNRVEQKKYTWPQGELATKITYSHHSITEIEDKKGENSLYVQQYEYDVLGRINKSRYMSGNASKEITYQYDSFGRLLRENNTLLDKTFVFVYDSDGNITEVRTHSYTAPGATLSAPISTKSFTYDETHLDRLVSFDGKAITYNANGEMTSYDGWDYSWSKGKLSSISKTVTSGSSGTLSRAKPILPPISTTTKTYTYDFTYNAFGQRTGVNYSCAVVPTTSMFIGEITDYTKRFYYDHSGRLMLETKATNAYGDGGEYCEIVYLYDQSSMVGMQYTANGITNLYYFQRNLQGDVIGIYDTNGNLKVRYIYDAWGNCTIGSETTDQTLAKNNPIRYRGYYFDADTGLYYLNARYYSPELRRFISPDDTAYLDPENANGLNLYAYCYNDPVNYADPSGHDPKWWQWLISGVEVAGGIVLCFVPGAQPWGATLIGMGVGSIINGYINQSNEGTFTAGWVGGQIGGLLSKIPGIGIILGSFAGSVATDYIDSGWNNIDWEKAFYSSLIAWGVSFFPGVVGEILEKSAKAGLTLSYTPLYFINTSYAILAGTINSVMNVYWRGAKW